MAVLTLFDGVSRWCLFIPIKVTHLLHTLKKPFSLHIFEPKACAHKSFSGLTDHLPALITGTKIMAVRDILNLLWTCG